MSTAPGASTAASATTASVPATAKKKTATATASATATAAAKKAAAPQGAAAVTVAAAAAAPAPAAGVDPVSVSGLYGFSALELLNQATSVRVQQLQAMKATGMTSVRLDASWYWGQPNGAGTRAPACIGVPAHHVSRTTSAGSLSARSPW